MIGIVVSRADTASVTIGDQLRDLAAWESHEDDSRSDGAGGGTVLRTPEFELREFDAMHLDLDGVASVFEDPDLVVFASKHAGDTGKFLTAHHTGNFGPAEFGGEPDHLAEACPNAHSRVVNALADHAPEGYETGMECTHHGPTAVGCPSMFVELGSSAAEWADAAGGRAVARAILDLEGVSPHRRRQIVGFGGGHYVPRFERITRETDWAVGHIGADWALDSMGAVGKHPEVVERAFERSGASHAVVEGTKPDLEGVIEGLGHRVVSETWLRETTGVPLELVERAETELTSVDEGLRFGESATDGVDDPMVARLPADLVAEANGIDRGAALDALERHALAFDTDESGTRAGEHLLVASAADRDRVVEAFVGLLERAYEGVERDGDVVVVRETAFDPAAAHEVGVPEGPKFGRLADGEAVTVDGRTIQPESVHTERERRFETRA